MAGVIFVNPDSGKNDSQVEEIRERFPDDTVRVIDFDNIETDVSSIVHDGIDFIGVAGGDGTVRTFAELLCRQDIPLLVLPCGTRNHFAKDNGIGSIEDAANALVKRQLERIDVGSVNGHAFINNASIGTYPKIVNRRETKHSRLPKGLGHLVATFEQLRKGKKYRVQIDGESMIAWIVFVGNGPYGKGLVDLADRESLKENILDVRVVLASSPFSRFRLLMALMFGRIGKTRLVQRRSVTKVTVDSRETLPIALDGEVVDLQTPYEFRSEAGQLLVFTPT